MMLKKLINSHLNQIGDYIDSTFDKINNFIDQAFIIDCPIGNVKSNILEASLPKIDQFNLIDGINFQKKIAQEIKPIINSKIKDELQKCQQILSPSQFNSKQFSYEILQGNSKRQTECCRAIALNKNCSLLVAGCDSQIKVFEFNQGLLTQLQVLNQHKRYVSVINFMEKSNNFVSGSEDSQIIIWSKNQSNEWISQFTLNEHTNLIFCLIHNQNEDLIISGSRDKMIKFWAKQNQWLRQQTITNHNHEVLALSLNNQQNKLISCGYDDQILIIEKSQLDTQWNVTQTIKVETGFRICFINNDTFIFQPYTKEYMQIFQMNIIDKQFTKIQEIAVKCRSDGWALFPLQFISSKNIVVNKNGCYVNLIRKNEKQELRTQQSIDFGTCDLFGQMSEDGEYLITWDNQSKEIQIRKYQEQ